MADTYTPTSPRYSIRRNGYHRYYAATRSEAFGLLLDKCKTSVTLAVTDGPWAVFDLTEERFVTANDLINGYDYERLHPSP